MLMPVKIYMDLDKDWKNVIYVSECSYFFNFFNLIAILS